MKSMYTDQILNAVASNCNTTYEICGRLGISYNTGTSVINKLVDKGRLFVHKNEGPVTPFERINKTFYTLSYRERWRLMGFNHEKIFIDNNDLPTFPVDKLKSILKLDDIDIYRISIPNINLSFHYMHTHKDVTEIFDLIDSRIEFKSFLPILIVFKSWSVSTKLVRNINIFSVYRLPILIYDENTIEWINKGEEIKIKTFKDSSLNRIYNEIKRRYPYILKIKNKILELEEKGAPKSEIDKLMQIYKKNAITAIKIANVLKLQRAYTVKEFRILEEMGLIEKEKDEKWLPHKKSSVWKPSSNDRAHR